MLIFIFSNECEILPDYQSCHVVQIYGEDFNILPAWHVDQSVKYSANQTDFPSQAGVVIHRPVPD
ncbi:hypothetical protein KUM43_28615 (plasmid) [Klebsiella pneumoniae]|uniref:hypothetical protein n=1 Tax=Klebsiella pneumoniae TaxID=573 RepID=UPI001C3893FD|nr:hypothetical protein [Klebsiella pneumoniae]QXG74245.1 hypothetical protein KUM43_28615 [Klebsiella pneumoniae]